MYAKLYGRLYKVFDSAVLSILSSRTYMAKTKRIKSYKRYGSYLKIQLTISP